MQTKHPFVLIHIRNKGDAGTKKQVSLSTPVYNFDRSKFQVSSFKFIVSFLRFTIANNMRCMYNISKISAWR